MTSREAASSGFDPQGNTCNNGMYGQDNQQNQWINRLARACVLISFDCVAGFEQDPVDEQKRNYADGRQQRRKRVVDYSFQRFTRFREQVYEPGAKKDTARQGVTERKKPAACSVPGCQ